jgi:hypothetical protein
MKARSVTIAVLLLIAFGLLSLMRAAFDELLQPRPTYVTNTIASSGDPLSALPAPVVRRSVPNLNPGEMGAAAEPEPGEPVDYSPEHRAADLKAMFAGETDEAVRIQIATRLGEVDSPAAAAAVAEFLSQPQSPAVFMALARAAGGTPRRIDVAAQLVQQLAEVLDTASTPEERIEAQNALGEIETEESAEVLRRAWQNASADPLERLNAAENLMRMDTRAPGILNEEEIGSMMAQVQVEARATDDPDIRSQAIMALAERREENREFFQQLLAIEQNESVRELLLKLAS